MSSVGDFLKAELDRRGMSASELARLTGRPRVTITNITHGRTGLSVEMALELEDALGIPAEEWLMRQIEERLAEARLKRQRK